MKTLDLLEQGLPSLRTWIKNALVWSSNTVGATICQLRNGAF